MSRTHEIVASSADHLVVQLEVGTSQKEDLEEVGRWPKPSMVQGIQQKTGRAHED